MNAALLERMNQTSASHSVSAKSVKELPVRYECTLRQVIPICSLISDAAQGVTVILLDVKSVYVRDDLYQNGKINQQLIDSVGKMGGDQFSLTSECVEMGRPITL